MSAQMVSACGVLCSDCPAYLGKTKGLAHQQRTVQAWERIYGLKETAEQISCGGCLGPDEQLFHTSVKCKARRCCRSKGFQSCNPCGMGCRRWQKDCRKGSLLFTPSRTVTIGGDCRRCGLSRRLS